MNFIDRLWVVGNKKKPAKFVAYFSTAFGYFVAGFAVGVSLFLVYMNYIVTARIIFVAGILLGILGVWLDTKKGYVNAVHKHSIKLWEERRKRVGIR